MELHYKVFSSIDLTSTIRAQLSSIIASSFPPENNQLPQFNAHINGSHSSILVAFSDFNEPVGLICFQKRNSTLFGLSFPFYVAGPIATHSSFFGRGVCTFMLNVFASIARRASIGFICLSGIPDFYIKHGYFPFFDKSKIVLSSNVISHRIPAYPANVSIEQSLITPSFSPKFSYGNDALTVTRLPDDWNWLQSSCSDSYYFPNPTLFQSTDDEFLFFTFNVTAKTLIVRELLASSPQYYRSFLYHINQHMLQENCDSLEIYTSYNSPLFQFMRTELPFQFSSFPHPTGRSLIKLTDQYLLLEQLSKQYAFSQNPVLADVLKSIDLVLANSTFLNGLFGFDADYFVPALLTRSIFIDNLSSCIINFQKAFKGFSVTCHPPTLYQGDSL